jgi:hypothetical protein
VGCAALDIEKQGFRELCGECALANGFNSVDYNALGAGLFAFGYFHFYFSFWFIKANHSP